MPTNTTITLRKSEINELAVEAKLQTNAAEGRAEAQRRPMQTIRPLTDKG